MLLFAFSGSGAPARAGSVELAEQACVAGSETLAGALAQPVAELDCGPDRFENSARFVRVRSDLRRQFVPAGPLVWQTDPGLFQSLLLRLTWSDGSDSWIDVDPQMAARNWAASSLFSVPLPQAPSGAAPVAIDAVYEQPRMIASLRDARILPVAEAARSHFLRSLLAMLAVGLLLAPIVHTSFFYRVLKARFMLWYAGMSAAMAGFVLTHSGLVFALFPGLALEARWQVNATLFLIAIGCAIFFVLSMLEPKRLSQRWRRILLGSFALVVISRLPTLLGTGDLALLAGRYFALAFLPLAIALPCALGAALRGGSRVALFGLVGFGALAITGLLVILDTTGLVTLGRWTEDAMLFGLVGMSLACGAGVGDRFMVLRLALDRERRRAAQLGALAYTDPLTGVGNRRAFDSLEVLGRGQGLLVADLDRFKAINDHNGHSAGDAALCRFVRTLRQCLEGHPDTAIYRLGGEEFAILFATAERDTLFAMCETIREAVAAGGGDEADPPVTVSIGAVLGADTPIETAFAQADAAMYDAKRLGRNRCLIAGDPVEEIAAFEPESWQQRRSWF